MIEARRRARVLAAAEEYLAAMLRDVRHGPWVADPYLAAEIDDTRAHVSVALACDAMHAVMVDDVRDEATRVAALIELATNKAELPGAEMVPWLLEALDAMAARGAMSSDEADRIERHIGKHGAARLS